MIVDPLAAIRQHLRLIGLIVFVLALAGCFWAGCAFTNLRWEAKERKELAALSEQVERDKQQYLLDRAEWDAKSQVDAAKIEALDRDKDMLLATISSLRLTRTIKVAPNAQGECESVVLDPDFRMRWNSVVTSAAATASGDGGS